MPNRLLVLGDIHGAAKALTQVLERSNFDPTGDRIIFLGDVADGWSETPAAIDTLLKEVPDRIDILGNHDEWARDWVRLGWCETLWWCQGGQATVQAYQPKVMSTHEARHVRKTMPVTHEKFFTDMIDFYAEDDMVFTHGGFAVDRDIIWAPPGGYNWDRWFWEVTILRAKVGAAHAGKSPLIDKYTKAFIGHTTTSSYSMEPVRRLNIWNLDQGAGWNGKLTLMDAHTEEYWQSDLVGELYPDELGRRS